MRGCGRVPAEHPPAAVEFLGGDSRTGPGERPTVALTPRGRPSYNAASGRQSNHAHRIQHRRSPRRDGAPRPDRGQGTRESVHRERHLRARTRAGAPSARRTPHLLDEGKGEREIAALMEHQHRTIVAAIRAGRFDGRLEQAGRRARGRGAATEPSLRAPLRRSCRPAAAPSKRSRRRGAMPAFRLRRRACEAAIPSSRRRPRPTGPTLDQVILDYLSTEAEQEHLVLVLDGHDEIRPGAPTTSTLRAYSSKSGLPRGRRPGLGEDALDGGRPAHAAGRRDRRRRRARVPARRADLRPRLGGARSSPAPPTSAAPRSSSCCERGPPSPGAARCGSTGRGAELPAAHDAVATLVAELAPRARRWSRSSATARSCRAPRWAGTRVAAGDRVELVRFVQGG